MSMALSASSISLWGNSRPDPHESNPFYFLPRICWYFENFSISSSSSSAWTHPEKYSFKKQLLLKRQRGTMIRGLIHIRRDANFIATRSQKSNHPLPKSKWRWKNEKICIPTSSTSLIRNILPETCSSSSSTFFFFSLFHVVDLLLDAIEIRVVYNIWQRWAQSVCTCPFRLKYFVFLW